MLCDFNCVSMQKDRVTLGRVRDRSAQCLMDVIEQNSLEDVAHLTPKGPVWFTYFQGTSHARLDRVYISSELVPFCANYKVEALSYSDHCLVSFCLGMKQNAPKWNWKLWKLKSRILKDEPFTELRNFLLICTVICG